MGLKDDAAVQFIFPNRFNLFTDRNKCECHVISSQNSCCLHRTFTVNLVNLYAEKMQISN